MSDARERIDQLVKNNDIVLFMKGSALFPQCGFSSRAVAILDDDVVLAASEFAANVIRHAHTPFTVRLNTDEERVRLEVSDGSSIIPAVEDLSESNRGLRMIEAISSRWGVEATESGKTVWAEFSMSPGGRG